MTTLVYADRVAETVTNPGSATFQLQGAVDVTHQTFVSGAGSGSTVPYAAVHQTSGQWEYGYGVVTAGTPDTLTRVAILKNNSGGTGTVNFAAGTVDVFMDLSAELMVSLNPGSAPTAAGDTYYADGVTGTLTRVAIGAANAVMTSTGSAPQWATSLTLAGTLGVTGVSTLTGGVLLGDGTVGAPSLSFASEATTGFYRAASSQIGISIAGNYRAFVTQRFAGDGYADSASPPNGGVMGIAGPGANDSIVMLPYTYGHAIAARNSEATMEFEIYIGGGSPGYQSVADLTAGVGANQFQLRNSSDNNSILVGYNGNAPIGVIPTGFYIATEQPSTDLSITPQRNLLIGPGGSLVVGTDPGGTQLSRFGGTFHVGGAATFDSTVALGGLTYTFPASQAASTALTTDGAGNLSWAAYPPLISANTTYIVAPSGGNFTSVQAAITALAQTVIAANAMVTIQVNDGTYANTQPVLMDGVFGKNIQVIGQHTYALSVTSVQSSSGSSGAWSIVLNVSSVANVAANDYVVISAPSGGTLPNYLAGVFKVASVDAVNTRITIASTHHAAAAPSGAVTATATIVKSILTFAGCDGFEIWGGASALALDKIVLVGDGTPSCNGISLQDVGRLYVPTVIGVVGFGGRNVYVNYNSEFNSDGLIAASGAGGDGFYLDSGGVLDVPTAIASGNGMNGVKVTTGGCWRALTTSTSTGNAQSGFLAQQGGQITATNPASTGNTQWGFLTASQGLISRSGATGGNNGSGDFSDGLVAGGAGTLTTSGLATIVGGASITGGALSVLGSFTGATGILFGASLTASGGKAQGIKSAPTLIAAANNDALIGLIVAPTLTPGSLTGLSAVGLQIGNLSTAAFTSPGDPVMLQVGVLTATGATNGYGLRIGIPTGATNNYLIAANTTSIFNVTAAGALTVSGTVTVGGGFGCNGKSAQTALASGGAAPAGGTGTAAGGWDTAAHRDAAITLLNNIRSALVANGIMS